MIITGIIKDVQPIYFLTKDSYTQVPLTPMEIDFISQAHEIFQRSQELLKRKYEQRGQA